MTITDPGSTSRLLPELSPVAAEPIADARPSDVVAQVHTGWPIDDEPPAGLGPWIPPLPDRERDLTARVLAILGAVVLVVVLAAAAAVAVVVGAGVANSTISNPDARYLDSVRSNSGLTSAVVADPDLVETGHAVCASIRERPAMLTVLRVMRGLGDSFQWNDDDVAAVVGSAMGAYCPEHIDVVQPG